MTSDFYTIKPSDLEYMSEEELQEYYRWLAEDERNCNYD